MESVNVYLAGGMKSGWQDNVKKLCEDLMESGRVKFFDPRQSNSSDPNQYIPNDERAVQSADIIFGCAEEDNPGLYALAAELSAGNVRGARTILVNQLDKTGEKNRRFRFVVAFCHCAEVDDLEKGVRTLRALLDML